MSSKSVSFRRWFLGDGQAAMFANSVETTPDTKSSNNDSRLKIESLFTDHVHHSIPKTPATFGFKIGYESNRTHGAVLVTEGDVTHYQIDPRSSRKAKDWFISNAPKILEDYDTTKEKGIWVITSIYAVKRRAHALLHSKAISVSFEINVQLQGAGKIAPSTGWWKSLESATWKDHKNVSLATRVDVLRTGTCCLDVGSGYVTKSLSSLMVLWSS